MLELIIVGVGQTQSRDEEALFGQDPFSLGSKCTVEQCQYRKFKGHVIRGKYR